MKIFAGIVGFLFLLFGAVFAWALWFTSVPAIDVGEGELTPALQAWFDERHEARVPQFNGAALVVKDGEVVLRGAWGKDGDGRPLTPSSQFRLASVSKSFTAAAILRLADQGKVELDTPLNEQLADCGVTSTPAQLMQHTSGLPDSYMNAAPADAVLSISMAVEGICATVPDAEAVGTYSYNNSAYVLLAGVVEELSGLSFEAFMSSEILEPLGMTDTRVWNLLSEDEFSDRATGFDTNGKIEPTNLDGIAGDGGVFSTVDDLRNWARFWRDERLIPVALKDRATGRSEGNGYYFGLGREGSRVSHNGGWLGARTDFAFIDEGEGETLVVLLDNGSSDYISEMNDQIWAVIAD